MQAQTSEQDWIALAANALEQSALGAAMRDSAFLYPTLNIVHLFGLVLIVGGIGLLDLRLIGFGRQVPLLRTEPMLTRMALVGILMQIGSGFCLFASDAVALIDNDAFRLKMLLFVLALGNAVLFRLAWRTRLATWDETPPFLGRVQSALSFLLWVAIAVLGRLIAYI